MMRDTLVRESFVHKPFTSATVNASIDTAIPTNKIFDISMLTSFSKMIDK